MDRRLRQLSKARPAWTSKNRQTEIKVNMDYIRKLGLSEGEDLGDGVVGEVKLADDTPDAGLNHSNDKDEAKACLLYTSRCV